MSHGVPVEKWQKHSPHVNAKWHARKGCFAYEQLQNCLAQTQLFLQVFYAPNVSVFGMVVFRLWVHSHNKMLFISFIQMIQIVSSKKWITAVTSICSKPNLASNSNKKHPLSTKNLAVPVITAVPWFSGPGPLPAQTKVQTFTCPKLNKLHEPLWQLFNTTKNRWSLPMCHVHMHNHVTARMGCNREEGTRSSQLNDNS